MCGRGGDGVILKAHGSIYRHQVLLLELIDSWKEADYALDLLL